MKPKDPINLNQERDEPIYISSKFAVIPVWSENHWVLWECHDLIGFMSILFFIWRFSFERSHFLLRFKQSQGYHSISSHQSSFFSILFDFILFFKVHSFKGPLIGVVNLYIFQYSIKRFWSSCNNIFFIVIFNYFILINLLKFYAYIRTICV